LVAPSGAWREATAAGVEREVEREEAEKEVGRGGALEDWEGEEGMALMEATAV
jgi:hypothetical protein